MVSLFPGWSSLFNDRKEERIARGEKLKYRCTILIFCCNKYMCKSFQYEAGLISDTFAKKCNFRLRLVCIASRYHACVTSNASKDKKVSMECKWREVLRENRVARIPSRYRHPIKEIERSCRPIGAKIYICISQSKRWQYDWICEK